mmetsp:Transcript_11644/g.34520  ORF Transcript_11644/g.34520 Transcript_11644/m.34520 type:complete len:237 (+) Transcript_11644:168-878(+)
MSVMHVCLSVGEGYASAVACPAHASVRPGGSGGRAAASPRSWLSSSRITPVKALAMRSSATAASSKAWANLTSSSVMRSERRSWRARLPLSCRRRAALSSSACAHASLASTRSLSRPTMSVRRASLTDVDTVSCCLSSLNRRPACAPCAPPPPPAAASSASSSSATRRVSLLTCSVWRRLASRASQSSFSRASARCSSMLFSASSCEMMPCLLLAALASRREATDFCSSARARRSS